MRNAHPFGQEILAPGPAPWWQSFALFLHSFCQLFARNLALLKKMRRSRPLPRDWRSFYPMLREAEWPIQVLKAEGARQILAGQPLDLRIPCDPDPPEDFWPAMPRSALAMHARIEETCRFNANPERYVRRHARRIRQRDDDDDSGRARKTTTTTIFGKTRSTTTIPAAAVGPVRIPAAMRIRAPP